MSHRNAATMRFVELDTGCFVPVSHLLNADGYLRKRWADGAEMFHRFIYRAHHDLPEVPEGYEVDHVCRNRPCCNPKHLRLLDRNTHLVLTNRQRYADRHAAARAHWETTKCTGTALADVFGVSFSIGCKWIRDWKRAT